MTLRTALIVSGDSAGGRKALADLDGAIANTEKQTARMGASAAAVGTQMAASAQASARAAVSAGAGYTVLNDAIGHNTIAMRESLVVTRELYTGNLTRLPGSLSILAQQFASSGQSAAGFASSILTAFGIIQKVGDEELAQSAASAAATAALVRAQAERAQSAIAAADAEVLLAEAAVRNAEGSAAETAAQERLAAAHQAVVEAAAEAAIAEDALAAAEESAGAAAAAAGAETTLALGPVGIALAAVAAAALPVIEAFRALKAEIDRQKLDDFARSMHLTSDEAAGLNDNIVKQVEKLEKNAADARDASAAHAIFARTAEGAIASVDDLTKHIDTQNLTLEQNIALQKQSLIGAAQNVVTQEASVSASLKGALGDLGEANREEHTAIATGNPDSLSVVENMKSDALANVKKFTDQLNALHASSVKAQQALKAVDFPLFDRNAKDAVDPISKINHQFDDMVLKAKRAGTYTQALATSIEEQRQAALEAAKATDTHAGAIGRHAAAAHAAKPKVDELAAAVGHLLNELFPVRAAEDTLAQQTDTLTKAWKAGAISAEEYGAAIQEAQYRASVAIDPPTIDLGDVGAPGKLPDLKDVLAQLPQLTSATDDWQKALQDIGSKEMKDLNNGLADAIVHSKSLGATFHDVAQQMLEDLIKLGLEEAEIAIFKAIGLPTLGFGGGRADGGPVSPGSFYTVNERSTAPGLFIPLGPGVIQPPGGGAPTGSSGPSVVELRVLPGQMFEPIVRRISGDVSVQVVQAAAPKIAQAGGKAALQAITKKALP